ncbi:MAG: hypothetical protein M1375_01975 [Candidatus Thermoplasmatota archaeon]|nr:hypothetical protein [Candidatus Thermoplasmatota archaeon]MCL5790725.1 hypothetical protein [Candidatus Thermoplasmatota archaeon]
MLSMRLGNSNRKIIAVVIAVIVASTSLFIFMEHSTSSTGKATLTVTNNPPAPAQPITSYLSNISVNMSVAPSFQIQNSNNVANIGSLATSDISSSDLSNGSFSGAVVELFASPSYPSQKYNNTNPSFCEANGSLPMTATFVNTSWTAHFRLPESICNITKTWRSTFGSYSGETSMIMDITYMEKSSSNSTESFFYTGAVPYNPFLMKSGYILGIDKHPYLSTLPYSQTHSMNISNTTTIYPGYSLNANNSSKSASPDYIPTGPGGGSGCKTYWGWAPVKTYSFLNQPIPFVYVNASEAQGNVYVVYSLVVGSTSLSTGFTLSSSYDNVNGGITIVGNTPTYETPESVIGCTAFEVKNNNKTNEVSVAGFYGNMTMVKYRYVEFALAGADAGKVIEKTDKYYVSMEIRSLDTRNGRLESFQYFLGNVTVGQYSKTGDFTSSSFQNLPSAKKYATAFAVLFSHMSTLTGTNIAGRFSGNYTIGPYDAGNGSNELGWSSIYDGVTIKSPNSGYYSEINSYISLGIALAGVALAVAPLPLADSVTDAVTAAGIIDALAGLGEVVASFFFTAVVTVQSTMYVYALSLINQEQNNVNVQYFLVINNIRIGSSTLDVPMADFLIE